MSTDPLREKILKLARDFGYDPAPSDVVALDRDIHTRANDLGWLKCNGRHWSDWEMRELVKLACREKYKK